MSSVEKPIRHAQVRINANSALEHAAQAVLLASGLWALALLVDRLFALSMPFWISVAAAAGLALLITLVRSYRSRVDRLGAAVRLDAAARLKERLSTALSVRGADPFVFAAQRDAQAIAVRVHVAQHLPYRAPTLWPWSAASVAAAALFAAFMPQLNLLAASEQRGPQHSAKVTKVEREAVKTAVDDQLNKIKKLAQDNESLKELADALEPLKMPEAATATPEDVRREAVKQLTNVAEKLEQQKRSDELAALRDAQRQLAQLGQEQQRNDLASKLRNELASGDSQAARETLAKMAEELKDAAEKSGDPQAAAKLAEMQQRTEALAKEIAKLNDQTGLQKELQNKAGLSAEDAKKLLEQLSKMDPQQLQQALQQQLLQSGMSQEQIQQLAQKLQQSQQAQQQLKELAQSLAQAAQSMQACQNPGNSPNNNAAQQAAAALADAAGQLSQMEMAQQAIDELAANLAEIRNLQQQIGQGKCQGGKPGQESDQIGNQGPQYGRGYGSQIGKEKAAHQMAPSRVRGKQTAGQIIGQQLVDGEQIRGEAQAGVRDAVNAALRDATDAIERETVPRQYERVAREYFEGLAGLVGSAPSSPAPPEKPAAQKPEQP